MNKLVKYGLGGLLLGLVLYNSVYFRRLSDVKAAGASGVGVTVSAQAYARTFWDTKLRSSAPLATNVDSLLAQLKTDKEQAFTSHAHALGIGNIGYFLVKGEGTVTAVNENEVAVTLPSGPTVYVATEYIFGNAARDASGLIQITEFDRQASLNTTDLNAVSSALNDIIRKAVVPTLKAKAQRGQKLRFVGALELNRVHLHLDRPTLIPILIQ